MKWLSLLFVLFLPSDGLLNLDFELCYTERMPLFYSERIQDTSVVTFYSLHDCKQIGSGTDIKPVACTNNSDLELEVPKVFPKDVTLRVELKTRRIAYCGLDTFRASSPLSVVEVERDPKCAHYEPKTKDAVRFYLLCDSRLPHGREAILLAISSKYQKTSSGHRLRWGLYGWCFSIIALCTFLLMLLCVKREIADNRRPKRSKKKKKGKKPVAPKTMPLAASATSLQPHPPSGTKTQSSVSGAPPLPAAPVVPNPAPAPKSAAPRSPAPKSTPAPAPGTPGATKTPVTPVAVVRTKSSAVLDPTQPPNTDKKENTGK